MKRQEEGVTALPHADWMAWWGAARLITRTHLWPWRGWCGALSRVDSWRCSGNLPRLTRTRSQYEGSSGSAGRTCAWLADRRSLWSRRLQGWVWNQSETEKERGEGDKEWWWHLSRRTLEAFGTVKKRRILSLTVLRQYTPSPAPVLSTQSWNWRDQMGWGKMASSHQLVLL